MSKIYQDALADAKKLREIAEQNAKNKIIEAVAPRIKQLIENELMSDDDSDSIEFFDQAAPSDVADEPFESSAPDDLVSDAGAELPSMEDPIADIALDLEPLELDIGSDPIEAQPTEFSFEKDGKQVKVSVTVEGKKSIKDLPLSKLLSVLTETKNPRLRKAIIKELGKIRKKLIIMSEAGDKSSRTKLNALNLLLKENKSMRRKNGTSRQLSEMWWLNEEDDEELDLDLEEEGTEEEAGEEEAEEEGNETLDALEVLGVDVEALKAELVSGDDEAEDEDAEGDDDDDEFELDLEEADEDEMAGMNEADEDEADYNEGEDKDEEVEISESMLRREISRMSRNRRRSTRRPNRKLAESRRKRIARRRRLAEMGDPVAAMHDGADEVLEVTEEDLINALADELGTQDDAGMSVNKIGDAAKQNAAFGNASAGKEAIAERRRHRKTRKQLSETRKQAAILKREAVAAKKELKESNLFNAKLLYVNKLMQSYDLNVKQQRAIVEALDNAKTLREAKLLYTTLTESLKKGRSTKGGTMNESASRTGSASKSVRSSAPANNGTELGRWAVLAGLNK